MEGNISELLGVVELPQLDIKNKDYFIFFKFNLNTKFVQISTKRRNWCSLRKIVINSRRRSCKNEGESVTLETSKNINTIIIQCCGAGRSRYFLVGAGAGV